MALNITPGATYVIVNTKSNTALDISNNDKRSVVGCKKTPRSQSQQWKITFVEGQGWHIQNHKTGQFLAFDGQAQDGAHVVVVSNPSIWHLWPDTLNIFGGRICVPSTAFNVDLDNGNAADGTRVNIWGRWDTKNQVWSFDQVH